MTVEFLCPRKFCVHLYTGYTEQHRVHRIPSHPFAAAIVHLLVGRNQSVRETSLYIVKHSATAAVHFLL